jgi:3-hydroxyacyl-[acyl-carrier-protein] dehydratase
MAQSTELHFAADHPTAAGHFPGDPIIPGALMLDAVVAAIAGDAAGPVTIRAAKFLLPVRPGARVSLSWEPLAGGTVRFECRPAGDGGLALTGTLEIGGK